MPSTSNARATPPTVSSNTQAPPASGQKRMQHKQPTSFQFVTFGDVDHMRDSNALSRIRRHAMKDIGLQRRKPKKKRFVEVFDLDPDGSPEDERPVAQGTDLATTTTAEEVLPSPIPAVGGGGIHSFLSLPIDLSTDPIGKSLLSAIFIDDPTNTVSRQTAHRNDWFFAGLKDPASFNQILANSELHTEALRHPNRWPRETEISIRKSPAIYPSGSQIVKEWSI
ncbi:hypothetical protein HII31_08961 [Pseudocercospora fuligena]|uniref:Uncharacterized protein n=1 Tax=Pseudocercospora fuligena TaxID=685502 RepID=A0A8H6VJ23_9PEZI|nr:hypothetical protein HII31_08961 [Pseudocercospora fuligena]